MKPEHRRSATKPEKQIKFQNYRSICDIHKDPAEEFNYVTGKPNVSSKSLSVRGKVENKSKFEGKHFFFFFEKLKNLKKKKIGQRCKSTD